MTVLMIGINGILGVLLVITLINVLTGPRLFRPPGQPRLFRQKISVLVPARNEEENLPVCLESLLRLNPPPDEILVLNDHSEDKTAEIIKEYADKNSRVRYLEGKALPAGWLGKTWACHQLSQEAAGDILVFTDADNWHHPSVLEKSLRWMEALDLDMLSAIPQQDLWTLPEKLTVPVVDMLAYAMIPLWLTRFTKFSSIAAANGQWIVFKKDAYQAVGGHERVAGHLVEDVALSRIAKKEGLHILLTAGTHAVFGRMYHNTEEVQKGFEKNLFGLTGFHSVLFFLIFSLLLLIMVFPYASLPLGAGLGAVVAVGLNSLIRLLLAVAFLYPPVESVILHPLSILYTAWIALRSWFHYYKKDIVWKGRAVLDKEKNS